MIASVIPLTLLFAYSAGQLISPYPGVNTDLAQCSRNAYMCCWTRSYKNNVTGRVNKNTDVCGYYGQTRPFDGNKEGDVHCHGLAWPNNRTDPNFKYRALLQNFMVHVQHFHVRGYYGGIKGLPTCDCIERMPIVSRADCTMVDDAMQFKACEVAPGKRKGDLRNRIELINPMSPVLRSNLVQRCDN